MEPLIRRVVPKIVKEGSLDTEGPPADRYFRFALALNGVDILLKELRHVARV
jgi:hypothetical protein